MSTVSDRFDGLDKFGLESLKNIKIYDFSEKNSKDSGSRGKEGIIISEVREEDVLFDKTYTCPCCDVEFKTKAIRAGRVKLEKMDNDLRPIYNNVDATKYETIVCPKCGYAGLIKTFASITDKQTKLIKESISSRFKGFDETKTKYTYDDAIERTQLALVSTVVKGGKNSEKAYVCLKLAWLIRGKKEELEAKGGIDEKAKKELENSELHYLKNAYEGFSDAYLNENFPIAGMDEDTISLILAETGRKLGHKDEAVKYISKIIISKKATDRMKDIAREIKENCKEE